MNRQNFFDHTLNEYKKANEKAKAEGLKEPGIPLLTRSHLRLEQFMSTTITQYNFAVLQGDNSGSVSTTQLPTEVRLQTNDNFHIHKIGFYIALTTASTDNNPLMNTYPNEVEYTANTRLGILNLYNGQMNITVNQVQVLTNWRLYQHFMVPQTQRISVAANAARDQVDLSKDGLVECDPGLMLSGAYTNQIQLNLPAAISNAPASNNGRIIIIYEGLRAQNAAIRK